MDAETLDRLVRTGPKLDPSEPQAYARALIRMGAEAEREAIAQEAEEKAASYRRRSETQRLMSLRMDDLGRAEGFNEMAGIIRDADLPTAEDVRGPFNDAAALATMAGALRRALHDAITRPMGVVPNSALPFYDPERYDADLPSADGLSELAKREAG